MKSLLIVMMTVATARADAPASYSGVFQPVPTDVAAPATTARVDAIAHAGSVQILAPATGDPIAEGTEVLVVQPLLGMAVRGRVEKSRVQMPGFIMDRRPRNDGVFVFANPPLAMKPVFVAVPPADDKAIRAVIAKQPALERVKKATSELAIGAVDLDGDKLPDVASTYGCTVWFDGNCQMPGQFMLVKRGGAWAVVE